MNRLKIRTDGTPLGTHVKTEGFPDLEGANLTHVSFAVDIEGAYATFCIKGHVDEVDFALDLEDLVGMLSVNSSSGEDEEDVGSAS